MKLQVLSVAAVSLLTCPASHSFSAPVGNEGGGGGGAWVCRDHATQKIESVELLDLFEARHMGYPISFKDDQTAESQVDVAIKRLGKIHPLFSRFVIGAWEHIKTHTTFGGSDLEIEPPADANPQLKKAGCKLEGMMYYSDLRKRL